MKDRWNIELVVRDKLTGEVNAMAVGSDEFPAFSERFVEDMKAGLAFVGPGAFDEAVTVMKKREFRRDILARAADILAVRLADYIEDKEGWHGERRRDTIKRA